MRIAPLLVVFITVLATGCANDPEYVSCGATDTMDICTLDTANSTGSGDTAGARGSLHVPVMPLSADLMKQMTDLQATMPAGVTVPMYRLDQYDLSVEYTVKNLDDTPGQFKIELNGANEMVAWDPTTIMPVGDEAPPTPGLAGDIPIDIGPKGQFDGVFREDQLVEATIDLELIPLANYNPFAATLVVNKNDQTIQPLNPAAMPTAQDPNPAQTTCDTCPAIPRSAFHALVRVDLVLKTPAPT